MTAALPDIPVVRPLDSLEARWMIPGIPGSAMSRWFARFPGEMEIREDTYLLYPRLNALSVKLRDGSSLDVKSYLGAADVLKLPISGCLERWRKWTFPYTSEAWGTPSPADWLRVRKRRRTSRFLLGAESEGAWDALGAAQACCAVELTEVEVRSELWWTIGFEATGSADLLPDALRLAADAVFSQSMPRRFELGLDNSLSYARWLSGRSAQHSLAQGDRAKNGALYM